MIQHAGQVPAQKMGWRDEPTGSREDRGLIQDGGPVMVRRNHNSLTGIDMPELRGLRPLKRDRELSWTSRFCPKCLTLVINHEYWKPILGGAMEAMIAF